MTNGRPAKKKWLFKGIALFLLAFLTACQGSPKPYIRETEEFYINDRSSVLLGSTRWTIYQYGEELYNDSQAQEYQDQKISGAQVVVATYVGQSSDFNTTELFNAWGIGENNMGLLLVLYFNANGEEYTYRETTYEMGKKMMGYLPAFRMSGLIDDYFDDPAISPSDYDQRLISLYFGIMQDLYLNVYGYDSYNYQSFMDQYELNKYEAYDLLPSDYERDPLPLWAWILIAAGVILFAIFPGRFILPYLISGFTGGRGGGGSSGGYWFRR